MNATKHAEQDDDEPGDAQSFQDANPFLWSDHPGACTRTITKHAEPDDQDEPATRDERRREELTALEVLLPDRPRDRAGLDGKARDDGGRLESGHVVLLGDAAVGSWRDAPASLLNSDRSDEDRLLRELDDDADGGGVERVARRERSPEERPVHARHLHRATGAIAQPEPERLDGLRIRRQRPGDVDAGPAPDLDRGRARADRPLCADDAPVEKRGDARHVVVALDRRLAGKHRDTSVAGTVIRSLTSTAPSGRTETVTSKTSTDETTRAHRGTPRQMLRSKRRAPIGAGDRASREFPTFAPACAQRRGTRGEAR